MMTCLTILAAIVLFASVYQGQIIMEPFILFFMDNEVVAFSVTCKVPLVWQGIGFDAVYIERNGVRLGEATAGSTPVLRQNMTGASIYGDVNKSITLNMTQTSCRDGGEYTCIVAYTPPGEKRIENRYSDMLMVSVQPGIKVVMAVSPIREEYCLDDIVQLSCSGLIGQNTYFSKIKWIWEYMNYLENSTWITYTESKIINDPPVSVNISCQNRQVSYIKRALTLEDNNRTYRCYLTKDGYVQSGNPPSYIFTVNGVLYVPHPDADVAWWIIVVAVVGGANLLFVIGIGTYLLRRSKNKEDTSEEGDEPQSADVDANFLMPNVVEKMKSLLLMIPNFDKGSDGGTTVDPSEVASSRGSISS